MSTLRKPLKKFLSSKRWISIMPQDAGSGEVNITKQERSNTIPQQPRKTLSQWLKTPRPIRRVFDKFPLVTYDANELPQRSATLRSEHALYVFITVERANKRRPSFNPGCLKWQAYLLFRGLNFVAVPSNNHASPNGALPFVLPAASASSKPVAVSSARLEQWTAEMAAEPSRGVQGNGSIIPMDRNDETNPQYEGRGKSKVKEVDVRYEAYTSLLDHRIRSAYLYTLYLCPSNFTSIVRHYYIDLLTANSLVRLSLSHQLRNAAQAELLRLSPVINSEALYRESDKAFSALSELLGHNEYFFAEGKPGLFDAHVFAYTNILLDEDIAWQEERMTVSLKRWENLIAHRERILWRYFPGES
ncbi:MAG: hypothetical protein Q9217_004452 [Psora testacea]